MEIKKNILFGYFTILSFIWKKNLFFKIKINFIKKKYIFINNIR